MERNLLADRGKAYACLLVLIGHVFSGIASTSAIALPSFMPVTTSFIWTFHIDLFMFLSGFVFSYTGGCTHNGNRFKFILNKFINLGVPYFVFSLFYILINSFTPGVNTKHGLSDVLKIFYEPVAQYWFLYALFFIFVIWTILSLFMSNWMITLLCYVVFIVLKIFNVDMGFINNSMNCILMFGLGACIKSLEFKKVPHFAKILTIAVHVSLVPALIILGFMDIIAVDDFASVLGIFSSLFFVSYISKLKPVSRFLDMICKYSLQIYLLHTFFTSAARIILLKLNVTNYTVHVLVGLIAGLALSLIVAWICSLTPILSVFFSPVKSFKKLRKK